MDKTVTLTMTHKQFDLVMNALSDRPLKEVYGTFTSLLTQFQAETTSQPEQGVPFDEPMEESV